MYVVWMGVFGYMHTYEYNYIDVCEVYVDIYIYIYIYVYIYIYIYIYINFLMSPTPFNLGGIVLWQKLLQAILIHVPIIAGSAQICLLLLPA
jgi:hypothetical protein